jgi:hypothetical protein
MLADTMKMPDPIIDPATNMVASVKVIALTNSDCGSLTGGVGWRAATLVIQLLRRLSPGQDAKHARVAKTAAKIYRGGGALG